MDRHRNPRRWASLGLLLLAPGAALAQDVEARAAELAAAVDAARALRGDDLAARAAALAPAFGAALDLEHVGRALFGAGWSALDPPAREELSAAMQALTAAAVAGGVDWTRGGLLGVGAPDRADGRASVSLAAGEQGDRTELLRLVLTPPDAGARLVDVGFGEQRMVADWRARFDLEQAAADPAALAAALRARAARQLEPPPAVVGRLQAGLLDAMQRADELGFEGRRALLAPLIEDTHDLESITKLAVARDWRRLEPQQRGELVAAFRRLSIATYAARFDAWSGQSFEDTRAEDVERGVLVKARLVTPGGEAHGFDYLMRRADGCWKILNIVVDGVSDLALKRQEYGDVVAEKGFAALIEKLRAQTARYEAGFKD